MQQEIGYACTVTTNTSFYNVCGQQYRETMAPGPCITQFALVEAQTRDLSKSKAVSPCTNSIRISAAVLHPFFNTQAFFLRVEVETTFADSTGSSLPGPGTSLLNASCARHVGVVVVEVV